MLPRITSVVSTVLLAGICGVFGQSAPDIAASELQLQMRFTNSIRPFLDNYCISCHGTEKPKAEFTLSPYDTLASVVRDHGHWNVVMERLESGEMPPDNARKQPAAETRREVVDWIQAVRHHEARRNAGDPGIVLARRLSNAEYDYSVRDLTGVDIRPAREFPVDPANEAGFDNSGESLAMSPSLLKKYLEAARHVTEFVVFKPDGLAFAPYPVVADTDRDKYSVNRIIDFYQRQETDYARYFEAAWRFKHRAALDRSQATLATVAAEANVSPKYLATVWTALETPEEIGPMAKLQSMWRELPRPGGSASVNSGCEQMRDFVVDLRKKLVPEVANLAGGRVNNGSQPLLMWKNRQWAANRTRYDPGALQVEGAASADSTNALAEALNQAVGERAPDEPRPQDRRNRMNRRREVQPDPNLQVPADPGERALHEAAFERFCRVFPDAFYVSERGRTYADQESERARGRGGRLLNAGFHSMTGYFRDDGPLCELMLDADQQRELDKLWDDFFFMSSVAVRMHTSFLWFERSDSSFMMSPEFGFTRPEDKNCTDEEVLKRLSATFENKARTNGASEVVLNAIRDHFDEVNTNVRWLEKARLEAVSHHLRAVQEFAERAFRRPLSPSERDGLVRFYQSLRNETGLEHEDAIRDTLASVLMSPHFCYRVDLVRDTDAPGRPGATATSETALGWEAEARPLSDYALASRLSYFLWSSMPDQELLDAATAGKLRNPEALAAQARRMLKDGRSRGFATEFVGNWLDFRRFEEHNGVDRERFTGFNNDLRAAMFEEPIRFALDVMQGDRSVLDFLYAKHTFVNPALAVHYGMPAVEGGNDRWVRIESADQFGRGGLLPMAVFLTANSPGLRTSPVKRGYWVVRRVLGEHIPPPPPDVPELPSDEKNMGDLTLRQVLERHRADKSCASCHARFDSFGLVFEGYGPVGERRTTDFGGKAVDTRAEFPNGGEDEGLEGLIRYVRSHRQDDFIDNLCRKLLAYALGRTLILSDDATVSEMRSRLAANGYRFDTLIETIVTSPQFLNKRIGGEFAQQSVNANAH